MAPALVKGLSARRGFGGAGSSESAGGESRRFSFTSFRLSDIESISDRDLMGRNNGAVLGGAGEHGVAMNGGANGMLGGKPSAHHTGERPPHHQTNKDDDFPEFAEKETSQVRRVRRWLLSVLVLIAAVTCFCAYWFTRQSEEADFEHFFAAEAERVKGLFLERIRHLVYSADSLARSYETTSQSWPNVTLEHFSGRAEDVFGLAQGAQVVGFAPFIPEEPDFIERQWEAFATENQDLVLFGDEYDLFANDSKRLNNRRLHQQQHASRGLRREKRTEATFEQRRDSVGVGTDTSLFDHRSLQGTAGTPPNEWDISDGIYRIVQRRAWPDPGPGPFYPLWQTSDRLGIMYNQMSSLSLRNGITSMERSLKTTFVDTLYGDGDQSYNPARTVSPRSIVLSPILEPSSGRRLLGTVSIEFDWDLLLSNMTDQTIDYVLESHCEMLSDPFFTFRSTNGLAVFANETGDFHEEEHDDLVVSTSINQFHVASQRLDDDESNIGEEPYNCAFQLHIYPTPEFQQQHMGPAPIVYASVVAGIFIVVSAVFLAYDWVVERRTQHVIQTAARTSAIVHNLFPQQVRERMFRQKEGEQQHKKRKTSMDVAGIGTHTNNTQGKRRASMTNMIATPKIRLRNYLSMPLDDEAETVAGETTLSLAADEPIADLFPSTTVMFADIAGFTAWSSEREPSQVFKLLESLYRSFDEVANRLGVFKVETIGDCYVAVTGLYPDDIDKLDDHATIMARFAFECLYHMHELTKKLETALGPGTTDLALRVGLHSGPVTAGVLRGEKSRFQLFGDTVNTAARMESTGQKNRIQVSEQTAGLIRNSGKSHWLTPRDHMITAKGKGTMQTYWLKPRRGSSSVKHDSAINFPPMQKMIKENDGNTIPVRTLTNYAKKGGSDRWADLSVSEGSSIHQNTPHLSTKKARLVNWNVDLLLQLLTKVVARRKVLESLDPQSRRRWSAQQQQFKESKRARMVLEEVTEIIELPKFDANTVTKDPPAVVLGERVKRQLRDYITRIAALYHEVPFHNFEHASHVTMSAHKLLKRIIRPEEVDYEKDNEASNMNKQKAIAHDLHYCSFGISSDPLTQLAIVFSALIHDVDHTGLPNSQLVKEKALVAIKYHNKSVAEQNSVDIAWSMLMEPKYEDLRTCIWASDVERKRFRQLVVNCIMATDIMDKDQQLIRKKRWDRAFLEETTELSIGSSTEDLDVNRKATSAIEHIIQASDVAHCMQHWRIYSKWNERLFQEMYAAYKCGRAAKDPSNGWYEGEIWFFDNYIIPLARKLKECGVFGVASDEYLTYALENRKEWEVKGRQVCRDMLEKVIQLDRNARTGYSNSPIVDLSPLYSQNG